MTSAALGRTKEFEWTEATAEQFEKRRALLSWRPPSPNKRLTYEKCFVHPMIDYKLELNF